MSEGVYTYGIMPPGEQENTMNNRKQQALDALEFLSELTDVSKSVANAVKEIREFIESVDSVDLRAPITEQLESTFKWNNQVCASDFRNGLQWVLDNFPDTINTSCRCEELEKQVKHFEWLIKSSTESFENALDERDKHISELQSQLESETLTSENRLHSAETFRNELEYSRRYGRELQSQLEAEQRGHDAVEKELRERFEIEKTLTHRLLEKIENYKKEIEAERAAHAETRAKLEELENDYNELSERYNQTAKQLEAASAYIPKTNPCMLDDFGNMTSVESDELPTKAELLEEMQLVADYVNNGATSEHYYVLDVVHSEDDDTIEFKTAALGCEHVSMGKPYGYRKEPVAPADGEPVYYCLLDCGGSETIGIAVSTGEIRQGKLSVYAGTCLMSVDEWRLFSDSSRSSNGWKQEWKFNF